MSDELKVQPDRREPGKPETLRLKSISPGITVNDLDASLSWYRDVVGFHIVETFEHDGVVMGAALIAGVARLMLSRDDGAKGRDRVKGQAIRLYLTTSGDVDDVAAAIKARGGTLASEPEDMPWGARAFNLVDPDGFQLTITS